MRYAAPQWQGQLTRALARAKARLAHAAVDGVQWYWPAGETPGGEVPDDGSAAGAVRPGGLGPAPLRAAVGLGLPLRGLHARSQADARVLRAAAAVARPGDRLGQRPRGRRRRRGALRLRRRTGPSRSRLPRRARGRARRDARLPGGLARHRAAVGTGPSAAAPPWSRRPPASPCRAAWPDRR